MGLAFGAGHSNMSFELTAPILVVDDDARQVEMIRAMLDRFGFENVDYTVDCREAQELLQHATYELVISDLYMEPIGGLDLPRIVAETQRATRFLLITGSVSASTVAMLVGANDYLTKPFTPKALEAKLRSILAPQPRMAAA